MNKEKHYKKKPSALLKMVRSTTFQHRIEKPKKGKGHYSRKNTSLIVRSPV
jgi:stalled ribosome alternative rescue factor ArfA